MKTLTKTVKITIVIAAIMIFLILLNGVESQYGIFGAIISKAWWTQIYISSWAAIMAALLILLVFATIEQSKAKNTKQP